MGMLSRKKMLAEKALRIEKVDLGGGNFIFVKEMNGLERNAYEASLTKVDDEGNANDPYMLAKFVMQTACDEKGELIFNPGDHESLIKNNSGTFMTKIATAATKINATSQEDKKEVSKNSEADQSDNSTSDSVAS